MTLHWWMHWFWITCQFTFCILLTHSMPLSPLSTDPSVLATDLNRPLRRSVKSIGQPQSPKSQISITIPFPDTSDTSDISIGEPLSQLYKTKITLSPDKVLCLNLTNNITTTANNSTPGLKNETLYLCNKKNISITSKEVSNETTSKVNLTATTETTLDSTDSDENVTTESNTTRDVMVNNTLTSVIVTKELVSAKVADTGNVSSSSLTAVSITGISFGVLVFAAFIGVTSFLLYRRRYLNKPQTLNDRCSNHDSSYIDDTMRENLEEMYSLDNDSFLNSLEAMTIQNYWTDSVKHTKL